MTNRYSCFDNMFPKLEKNEYFEAENLPVGIKELNNFFASDTICRFGCSTSLPLLKKTNSILLERYKKNILNQNKNLNVENISRQFPGVNLRKRPSAVETDLNGSDDVCIIRSCWDVILSFMEDGIKMENNGTSSKLASTTTAKVKRQHLFSSKKFWHKINGNSESAKQQNHDQRPFSMVLLSDFKRNSIPESIVSRNENKFLSNEVLATLTVSEKVHYLAKVGLEVPVFRDEILCMIVKQLVENPSMRSSALGWILFSLILGCFSPSSYILPLIEVYLRHLRTGCSSYCLEKLKRTLEKGDRKNPPCSLELQSAKTRQAIRIPVICMDHSVRTIPTDSASTAAEVCHAMAEKTQFNDSFGFALYLALDEKLVCLGSRSFHIMDAISQAESFSKINDVNDHWRIYFRRDYFTPRGALCLNENRMKTWLTYFQICGGVTSGEYQCAKSQDLCLLISHQYIIKYGVKQISKKKVQSLCDQTLPSPALLEGRKKDWCQMVYDTLKVLSTQSKDVQDEYDVMKQVVCYGSKAFKKHFTKTFHLTKFRAMTDSEKDVFSALLSLNHASFVVTSSSSQSRKALLDIHNGSVKSIEAEPENNEGLRLSLQNGKVYLLESPQKDEIFYIMNRFAAESLC